jgi:hypothetical protein
VDRVGRKVFGSLTSIFAAGSWIFHESIKAWFFDKIVHVMNPWDEYLFHYGIPLLFAGIGIGLFFKKPSSNKELGIPHQTNRTTASPENANGWPRLTDEQRLLISGILVAGNRAGKVNIMYSSDDGALFAKDLAECLREQRWDVSTPRRLMPEQFFEGIQLRTVPDVDNFGIIELSGVNILARALIAIKLRTILSSTSGSQHDTTVIIAIGHWIKSF